MEKTKIFLVSLILLLVIVGFYFYVEITKEKQANENLYEAEKRSMQDSLEASKKREAELIELSKSQIHSIDSLEQKQKEIQKQTDAAKDSIDKILAMDSTKALQENRKALNLLGISTSSNPFLTNYEMGWNAKFLQENYGLKLQIKTCDETKDSLKANIKTEKKINAEKDKQIVSIDSLKTIADLNAEQWKKKYESTQSFWDDRLIVYGGGGINYNPAFTVGLQAGIGFRLFTIKLKEED